MGAWGTGPFENDEASDFLYDVEESKNFDLLEEKINEVMESKAEDAHAACEAVAASAILAAVHMGNAAGLPDEAAAWVKARKQAPPIALLEQAARALEMIYVRMIPSFASSGKRMRRTSQAGGRASRRCWVR